VQHCAIVVYKKSQDGLLVLFLRNLETSEGVLEVVQSCIADQEQQFAIVVHK